MKTHTPRKILKNTLKILSLQFKYFIFFCFVSQPWNNWSKLVQIHRSWVLATCLPRTHYDLDPMFWPTAEHRWISIHPAWLLVPKLWFHSVPIQTWFWISQFAFSALFEIGGKIHISEIPYQNMFVMAEVQKSHNTINCSVVVVSWSIVLPDRPKFCSIVW